MKGELRSIDESRYFFLAEHLWQMQNLLRIRRLGDALASLQYLNIEEAQGCQPLGYGVRDQLPTREQRCLILANVFWTKLIG